MKSKRKAKNKQEPVRSVREGLIRGVELLRRLLLGVGDDEHDRKLASDLGSWLESEQNRDERLVIGFVKCNQCGCTWEAIAYENTLGQLECPSCHTQSSEVIGASMPQNSSPKERAKDFSPVREKIPRPGRS